MDTIWALADIFEKQNAVLRRIEGPRCAERGSQLRERAPDQYAGCITAAHGLEACGAQFTNGIGLAHRAHEGCTVVS
jgi:hypothetical protein